MKIFSVLFIIVNCAVLHSFASDTLGLSELELNWNVKYWTYTKADRNSPVDIRVVNFRDNYTSVFVIHGFEEKSLDNPLKIKDDLFQWNANVRRVIIVDWRDYSFATDTPVDAIDYDHVAQYHAPDLAQDLFEKIAHIQENSTSRIIELVGFSVGAHVAGQTGKLLKSKIGYTVDRIYGLDPAGRYFQNNSSVALNRSDAKNVIAIHTNMGGEYGFGTFIGDNDKKSSGGHYQPDCADKDDFCSHHKAWNAFSKFLSGALVTRAVTGIPSYVFCIDTSGSMNYNHRLERATHAAKKIILNLKLKVSMGIVTFDTNVTAVREIVEIQEVAKKNYLIQSFPNVAGGYYTYIGAGLRRSMNMLQDCRNISNFRRTIVLISDGEDNGSILKLKDVSKEIADAGIIVSSIVLGNNASQELEEISRRTGGSVSYAPEDKSSKDITGTIQAVTHIFGEIDDQQNLPSHDVSLSNGEVVIPFTIDERSGKNTVFEFVSYEVDKVDIRLLSPNGKEYSAGSYEYFYVPNVSKGFRFSYADAGQWNLTVTRNSKARRSARSLIDGVCTCTTKNQIGKTAIQLKVTVSNRTLEYPRSITITAKLLGDGEYPIIDAEIYASIRAPNQPIIHLRLRDNGVFPDQLANDGVYENNVIKLPSVERYSVLVTARSKDTTMLVRRQINYFTKDTVDCKSEGDSCERLSEFEREANGGSIKLLSHDNEDRIPPHLVCDLRGRLESKKEKIISLEWTSPMSELFDMKIQRYDIRALINGTDFENGLQFEENDLVAGILNASNSTPAGTERISVKISDLVWNFMLRRNETVPGIRFAVKTVGLNDEISDRSNIAWVGFKENDYSSSNRLCSTKSFKTASTAIVVLIFVYVKIFNYKL